MWRGCRREPASDERVSVFFSVCLSAEDTDASGCAPRSLSCYLADPASSHMLVSKIKPCMSKFTLSNGETANGSLNQSRFLRWSKVTWITVVILELIHAERCVRLCLSLPDGDEDASGCASMSLSCYLDRKTG